MPDVDEGGPASLRSSPGARWRPSGVIRLSAGFHIVVLVATAADPALWAYGLGALALNHLALGIIGMVPRSALLGSNLTALPGACAERGEIALTFDDGPDPAVTPQVLDVLDRFGAKASFFCIGRRIQAEPDLAREIVRRGHSIENHTFSHPSLFACFSPARLRRELEAPNEIIEAATGRPPAFFRAPMGLRSPLLDPLLTSLDQKLAAWTCRGYDSLDSDPDRVLGRMLHGVKAGSILMLHDGDCARTRAGDPVVLDVLPVLLERISAAGLQAVSLPMAFGFGSGSISRAARFQQGTPANDCADDKPRMHAGE